MTPSLDNAVRRVVLTGGLTKAELLLRLQAAGVRLNEFAQVLFADPRFTAPVPSRMQTIELTVADLGLPEGGTFAAIAQHASTLGLSLCPLELGPHLRLQVVDQPEGLVGQPSSQNRAPPGSITVASKPIAEDDDTPKGFYLRRIEGLLWLRAYRSSGGHTWGPDDRLVFAVPGNGALSAAVTGTASRR